MRSGLELDYIETVGTFIPRVMFGISTVWCQDIEYV